MANMILDFLMMSMSLLLVFLAVLVMIGLVTIPFSKPRYVVLVLGDLGHSPRMQYHVRSLAQLGYVDFVGYPGSDPIADVKDNPHVRLRHVHPFRSPFKIPYLGYVIGRVVWESIQLMWFLIICCRPRAILVQNPPSIPTLLWATLASYTRWVPLVIDFHNFGYTMLAMKLGNKHPLVRISEIWEKVLGRFCSSSFCVSKAMQRFLKDDFSVKNASVMYDRPPDLFKPLEPKEQQQVWHDLREQGFLETLGDWSMDGSDKPLVIVSSTSWSPDEDFDILVGALPGLDKYMQDLKQNLLVFITGRGPLQGQFLAKVAQLDLARTKVSTAWLPIGMYPRLLASADFGLSLHASSSGLDLPMKVVDMFGAGLPVLALEFETIKELVSDGTDGLLFSDAAGLVSKTKLAISKRLELTAGARQKFKGMDWQKQWDLVAKPVFVTC